MFWPQHLGCWGQNTSRIQNKEVYATLCLQANVDEQGEALEEAAARLSDQDRYIQSIGEENVKLGGELTVLRSLEIDLQRVRQQERRAIHDVESARKEIERLESVARKQEDEMVQLRNRAISSEGEARVSRSVAKETEENDALLIRDQQARIDRLAGDLEACEDDIRRLKEGFVEKEAELLKAKRSSERAEAVVTEQEQDIRHLVEQIHSMEQVRARTGVPSTTCPIMMRWFLIQIA